MPMKNILIAYKIFSDISQEYMQKLVDGCKSSNHKVTILFHDFTIDKKIKTYVENIEFSNLEKINIINEEHIDATDEQSVDIIDSDIFIIQKLLPYSNFDIVSIVTHDIIFDGAIDKIDFSVFDDNPLLGSAYCDYVIDHPFKTRIYSKSHPLMSAGVRVLFVSMGKLIETYSAVQENHIGYLYNHLPSCHIPNSLFTITTI